MNTRFGEFQPDLSFDGSAAWSPDGAKIAFQRVVACDNYYCERDVFVMNADGSSVTQLTSGPDDHADRAWSPDGSWIACSAAPCSFYEGCYDWRIKVVRCNGTDVWDVIGPEYHPAWRP